MVGLQARNRDNSEIPGLTEQKEAIVPHFQRGRDKIEKCHKQQNKSKRSLLKPLNMLSDSPKKLVTKFRESYA